jgi:predicted DNA-binding protein (MmcQ/YjbR family)
VGLGKERSVDGATLQRLAAARTAELPGTDLEHPFGPDWDVYKVRGKVFMLHTSVTGAHWITLGPGPGIDAQLVEDLVTESYLLVLERNLPRAQRPVDPDTFGQVRT